MEKITATKKASQEFVPIKEIRDGIMILKNGSMRMILMTSSLNFALKSNDEQTAIILQYQNFLNSLDFPLQFFIQSRALNIEPYLETLRKRRQEQTNELLKTQTKEYIDFVKEFVSSTKIVNKLFYVVIPYNPGILETKGNPFTGLLNKLLKKETKSQLMPQKKFEEHKLQIQQRADSITQGLSRMGIRSVPINTEELIELFYALYNPSEIEKIKVPEYETTQ